MAVFSCKAIVISSIKYSDTSLITKLFTEEKGLQSYMLKGVLTSKKGKLKAAYFQPLTHLKIEANYSSKRSLQTLKEAQVYNPYSSIGFDVVKQTIVLFLSEVLTNCIKEEEENQLLFQFLENSLLWLDTNDKVSNFHLVFLLKLSQFLGFYPDVSNIDYQGFNLIEGCFTSFTIDYDIIKGENLVAFRKLLGINFDNIQDISFTKKERQSLLDILIRYFELHLDGFKTPKSIKVLEAVFRR